MNEIPTSHRYPLDGQFATWATGARELIAQAGLGQLGLGQIVPFGGSWRVSRYRLAQRWTQVL
jgi:hypothetical protein